MKKEDSGKDIIVRANDLLAQSLYDVIEKSFYYLSKNLTDTQDLKKRELIQTLAKECGFKIDKKKY